MNRQEMKEKLQEKLSAKRFEHSIGVEYTAATLAFMHDIDLEKAMIAGLLHDCAKYLSHDKKIKKCEKYGVTISQYEYENPELLHAKLSAIYAKEKYNVTNPEILSAIEYHTTGKPNMSTLEKIIYISDYIEPNRDPLPEIESIRKEAYSDLDLCVLHILHNTVHYLSTSGQRVDPISIETYEFYKKLANK